MQPAQNLNATLIVSNDFYPKLSIWLLARTLSISNNMIVKIIIAALVFLLVSLFPQMSEAAIISKSTDGDCRIEISGPIEEGDVESLFLYEDHLFDLVSETSKSAILCLNSPGGSLIEGLRMAEFIYARGIGTRIREGAECLSICAIMFMMGNHSFGDIGGLNRRMHITASLGFHRPYISLGDANGFTSGDLEASYELALSTIFDIIDLTIRKAPFGSVQMLESDLQRNLLGTPGSDMYYVETVGQAIRWGIEVDGLPNELSYSWANTQFACENAHASKMDIIKGASGWSGSDHDRIVSHDFFSLEPWADHRIDQLLGVTSEIAENKIYRVNSFFAGEFGVYCEVSLARDGLVVCGKNEGSGEIIGECSMPSRWHKYSTASLFHPSSELFAFSRDIIDGVAGVRVQVCKVLNAERMIIDQEECLQEVKLAVEDNSVSFQHFFTWPSGSKTVVELENGSRKNPGVVRINGQLGETVAFESGSSCVLNVMSRNTFCVSN